jgi:hypothetical protein
MCKAKHKLRTLMSTEMKTVVEMVLEVIFVQMFDNSYHFPQSWIPNIATFLMS